LAAQFVADQLQTLRLNPLTIPAGRTAAQQSLINLCQVLLSSNEFLYVE